MSARSTRTKSRRADQRDLTDWARLRNMTEAEIEAGAASDPDNPPWTKDDFRRARVVDGRSAGKPVIWVHVDEDIRAWVHEQAGDIDERINEALRRLMEEEHSRQRT